MPPSKPSPLQDSLIALCDGLLELGPEGLVHSMVLNNAQLRRAWPGSWIGRGVRELLPGAAGDTFTDALHTAAAGDGPVRVCLPLELDTEPSWLELRLLPSGDRIHVLINDVSQHAGDVKSLRASERRLRDFVDLSGELVQLVDSDGSLVFTNKAWRSALGYTGDEIGALTVMDVIAPEHRDACMNIFERLMRGDHIGPFETIFLSKDGKRIPVSGQVSVKFDGGVPVSTRGVFRDVAERDQAVRALADSEAQHRVVVEAMMDALITFDSTSTITSINPAAERLFRYPPEALLGQNVTMLIPSLGPDERDSILTQAQTEGMRTSVALRAGGDAFSVELSLAETFLGGTQIFTTIVRDITERLEADTKLRRSLRLKDEFLANMSHELRTPLSAVLGLTEVLTERLYGPLNDKQHQALKTISQSGQHLLDLINDIIDLSRLGAGKVDLHIEQVDLARVSREVVYMLRRSLSDAKLHATVSATAIQPVEGDARRLRQVVINLLGNAIKFTPEGGEVGVELQSVSEGREVALTVWDTGVGIAQPDLGALFERFVQIDGSLSRAQEGTGLGLSLVDGFVRLHGGRVKVSSEPGKGSRFTVLLPIESPGVQRS